MAKKKRTARKPRRQVVRKVSRRKTPNLLEHDHAGITDRPGEYSMAMAATEYATARRIEFDRDGKRYVHDFRGSGKPLYVSIEPPGKKTRLLIIGPITVNKRGEIEG